jgi:hydroxyacylglutathione hydrolase
MRISCFTGGMAQTNGWLVERPGLCLLIDAPAGICEWLGERGIRVDNLWLTHQHYDHVEDAAALQEQGAVIHAQAPYSRALTLEEAARAWGMPLSVKPYRVDRIIGPDAAPALDGLQCEVAHVPGHALDSLTFHFPGEGIVFTGDTLFAGSIGRTDLPGGDTDLLLDGIARHLLTLPPSTRVLPGHGGETTIGREAASNPFL